MVNLCKEHGQNALSNYSECKTDFCEKCLDFIFEIRLSYFVNDNTKLGIEELIDN